MQETKQKEELICKIINILAYQQTITNQGINYTGEKDWALNRLLSLFDTLLAEEREKTINKIKIKVEKHKDKMKDYIWDGDSALEDVLDIINNLDKK